MTYYDKNAKLFFDNTVSVDMSGLYDEFLPLVPKAGHIFRCRMWIWPLIIKSTALFLIDLIAKPPSGFFWYFST